MIEVPADKTVSLCRCRCFCLCLCLFDSLLHPQRTNILEAYDFKGDGGSTGEEVVWDNYPFGADPGWAHTSNKLNRYAAIWHSRRCLKR